MVSNEDKIVLCDVRDTRCESELKWFPLGHAVMKSIEEHSKSIGDGKKFEQPILTKTASFSDLSIEKCHRVHSEHI